jgi:HTH-type transcriptional regulator / antitoxin HipB
VEYPIKTHQQIGEVLRGYRKERGLTQQTVAANLGITQKTVSKIEVAPARVSLSSFFKVLAALDLEIVVRPRGTPEHGAEW